MPARGTSITVPSMNAIVFSEDQFFLYTASALQCACCTEDMPGIGEVTMSSLIFIKYRKDSQNFLLRWDAGLKNTYSRSHHPSALSIWHRIVHVTMNRLVRYLFIIMGIFSDYQLINGTISMIFLWLKRNSCTHTMSDRFAKLKLLISFMRALSKKSYVFALQYIIEM